MRMAIYAGIVAAGVLLAWFLSSHDGSSVSTGSGQADVGGSNPMNATGAFTGGTSAAEPAASSVNPQTPPPDRAVTSVPPSGSSVAGVSKLTGSFGPFPTATGQNPVQVTSTPAAPRPEEEPESPRGPFGPFPAAN